MLRVFGFSFSWMSLLQVSVSSSLHSFVTTETPLPGITDRSTRMHKPFNLTEHLLGAKRATQRARPETCRSGAQPCLRDHRQPTSGLPSCGMRGEPASTLRGPRSAPPSPTPPSGPRGLGAPYPRFLHLVGAPASLSGHTTGKGRRSDTTHRLQDPPPEGPGEPETEHR